MTEGPIYTGPLPTQISGDIEQGKRYQQLGRKMMGTLLNVTGAAERIERGEPGGYFKKSLQMEDGTVITAITNNGQNILRIQTPRPEQQVEYKSEHRIASGSTPHSVFVPEAHGLDPSHEVPLPGKTTREWSDEEGEPKKESIEYMWVGARYTTPNAPFQVLGAMMIEPDTGPLFRDSGLPKRGIIDCINWWAYGSLPVKGGGTEWSLDTEAWGAHPDVDTAIYYQWDIWYNDFGGHQADQYDRAEQHVILGTHAIEVDINPGVWNGVFQVSATGLRCESINMWQPGNDATWCGFDPYADDQSGAGVRSVGDRQLGNYFKDAPNVLWDVVFTLDPHEDEQMMPVDSRSEMLAIRHVLEKDAGMVTQILPGDYILALHAMDNAPQLRSTRAGEAIPLYLSDMSGNAYRSATSDYIEYMQPLATTLNLGVEIEVRLGKGDQANVFHFETTIPECSYENWVNFPYGMDWYTPCDPDGGPNPAGKNFAPQYLAINPLAGSARWIDHDEVDLYPILGGGHYSNPGDTRVALDVFVHVVPWSQPTDEEWPAFAGRALWRALEAATAGVYGEMLFSDPGGEAGCVAIFEGTSKSVLWKYDAQFKTLTPEPVISDVNDYPYGAQTDEYGNTFQSPYEMNLYWYYPYKYIDRNLCRHSIGLAITAVFDSFSFDHGQHVYYADPPDTTDCC